jgi:S1/P1 Nuclease
MKKYLFSLIAIPTVLMLASWGSTGHRTIGIIAERHLTPQAKAAVQDLLQGESLADASTWADEVRRNKGYTQSKNWHFLNQPPGLNEQQFYNAIKNMGTDNIYGAVLQCQIDLQSANTTAQQKNEALKYIIHFVGDIHQPMHISNKDDLGGNKIQINYDGRGTNLHTLWDSKLIDHQGLSEEQMADQYDHASPGQIKTWQSAPMIKWLWESYQISSTLYTEIGQLSKRKLGDSYYQAHIGIIQTRIEQAGIRLAGLLNNLFKDAKVSVKLLPPPPIQAKSPGGVQILSQDVRNHIGENLQVCDQVYSDKELANMVLLNLGAAYPNQILTVVLKGKAKENYRGLTSKKICVSGTAVLYRGKPEIIVTDPQNLKTE